MAVKSKHQTGGIMTNCTPLYRLQAKNIRVQYGNSIILKDITVQLPHGKNTVIIGPNACGKSTLLKTLSRLLIPEMGNVLLDNTPIHQQNTKQVAQTLGVLPQTPIAPQGILVYDLVCRGRSPYRTAFAKWHTQDEQAVIHALTQTDTLELANREVDSLSGGQRQRVWIAMVIAQDTDILLLDEPTTFLDLPHQVEILELIKTLNQHNNRTIVSVLHDINLACRYADYIIAMHDGNIITQGDPKTIITCDTIKTIFNMDSLIIQDPITHTPLVIPK